MFWTVLIFNPERSSYINRTFHPRSQTNTLSENVRFASKSLSLKVSKFQSLKDKILQKALL